MRYPINRIQEQSDLSQGKLPYFLSASGNARVQSCSHWIPNDFAQPLSSRQLGITPFFSALVMTPSLNLARVVSS